MLLPEYQSRFFDAVLYDKSDAGLDALLSSPDCLDIYRNNAIETYRKTLSSTYPVIERLVGQDCFRSLSYEFMQNYDSISGDLADFGSRFAELLEARYGGTEYAYLSDVAQLEWAYDTVYSSPDADSMDTDALVTIAGQDGSRVHVMIHPACRFVFSEYPILEIWGANQPGADSARMIDVRSGGECVAVYRSDEFIELRVMRIADNLFLSLLKAGETLLSAFEQTVQRYAEFDLASALCGALEMRILTGWFLAPVRDAGNPRS